MLIFILLWPSGIVLASFLVMFLYSSGVICGHAPGPITISKVLYKNKCCRHAAVVLEMIGRII